MLVLARMKNESVVCDFPGGQIQIKVLRIAKGTVKLGFNAPQEVNIARSELLERDSQAGQDSKSA